MSKRKQFKNRIKAINFVAELFGSAIFSLLYFVFISRFLSPDFELDFIVLGLLIGVAYMAGVYIPFHTYRIHIIPFISIIRALQKKKIEIIYYKIPAQLIGAFLGTLMYKAFSDYVGGEVVISDLWQYKISNLSDVIFFNAITAFVLCYLFYVIQLMFRNMGFNSMFYYALVIQVVFIFTSKVSDITTLNVFGYFSLSILEGGFDFGYSWFDMLLVHFITPSFVAVLIYFYIKQKFMNQNKSNSKSKQLA